MGASSGPEQRDHAAVGRLVGGRYRIECAVGRGGMGEVFRARDEKLGMPVALKALPAEWAHDPLRRAQFEQEIAAQARATHPYVAQVLEFVEDGDALFLVMEFIEGRTLAAILREGRAAPADVRTWGRQIALALQAIHERKLLHRDLKPANVMITPQGIAKVTDFGIALLPGDGARARTQARALPQRDAPADADVTTTAPGATGLPHGTRASTAPTAAASMIAPALGVPAVPAVRVPSAGTPAYMSPEQHRGAPLDGRSDLFTLGIVLWEALTGRHPFRRDRLDDMREAICTAPPDGLNAPEWRGHPNLRRVLLRLLEKDPAQRFGNAAEVARAIESAREPWPLWLRASALAGAAAVLAVTSIAAGWPDTHPWWPPAHWFERNWPRMTGAESAVVERAFALAATRKLGEAVTVLDAGVREFPASLRIKYELARVLDQAGFEARARDAADVAAFAIQEAGFTNNDLPALEAARMRARSRARAAEQITAAQSVVRHWESANSGALTELADAFMAAGRHQDARRTISRYLELNPDNVNVRLALAREAAAMNDFKAADAELARARAVPGPPDEAREAFIAYTSGYINFCRPDFGRAASDYARAAELFAKTDDTRQALSLGKLAADALTQRADVAQGDLAAAERRYREVGKAAEAAGLYTLWVETLNSRGGVLRNMGSPDAEPVLRQAVDEARKLDDETRRVQPLASLANLLLEQGRLDEAEPMAREVFDIAGRHEDRENRNNAAFVLAGAAAKRGHTSEAIQEFRRVADDESGPGGRIADRAYACASLLEIEAYVEQPAAALRDGDVAVDLYRKIQDQATLAVSLAFRARVLATLGRNEDAARDLHELHTLVAPNDDALGVYVAGTEAVLALERGAPGEARDAARRALQTASIVAADEEIAAEIALAGALRRAGELPAAVLAARTAAACAKAGAPHRARANVVLAELLLASGRVDEARTVASAVTATCARLGMFLSEARGHAVLSSAGAATEVEPARRAWKSYLDSLPPDARTYGSRRPDSSLLVSIVTRGDN